MRKANTEFMEMMRQPLRKVNEAVVSLVPVVPETCTVYRTDRDGRCKSNFCLAEYGADSRGRYHGARRPSTSDYSFHSPTVIPPSALPSTKKRYHRRRTCSRTLPRRSPTMVTCHDTRFDESRWWNDGWTVKTVVT